MTSDETAKPKLEVVPDLDEDEKEFRALRRDLPGVSGAARSALSRSAWPRYRDGMNFLERTRTSGQ